MFPWGQPPGPMPSAGEWLRRSRKSWLAVEVLFSFCFGFVSVFSSFLLKKLL
jgi:hypothetical protein